jgi:CheY-like chemotaxis protein
MKRVLVVDDELSIRQVIGDILRDEGYQVLFAGTGRSALTLLATERPDLVLLDVMMPDGDGHAVLEAMQSQSQLRDIPVIIVSTGIARPPLNEVTVGFLDKPFDLGRLLEAVIGAIGPAFESEQS